MTAPIPGIEAESDMTSSLVVGAPRALRPVPFLLLTAGLGLVLGALFIEHVMGIAPCILCVYQRIPPALVAVLAGVAAVPRMPGRWARRLTALIGLVFLASAGLAGYHVGVEQHWWAGTAQCGGETAPPVDLSTNLADLRQALEAPEIVPCDAIPWSLLGISLAGYNMMISMLLAGLALWGVRRPDRWRER
ncbi:disulfide bond formation protein DsbB [Rhodospira trueperi]|uniref:Disulfide bond formation protein DsbB n=2 Tax=Rhodospira trueperi TaxID=69960 RepID=A0A1G7B1L4_9PROT|nr:disulfide bond formation protein DsbB [Rhodospira trueperi]